MPDDIRELRHPDFYGLQLAEQPVTQGARIARNVDTWKYGLLNKRPGLRRMNHRQYLGQIVAIADLQRICDYGKFLILSGLTGGGEIYEHQQLWFDPTPPGFAGPGPWGGGGFGGAGGGADPEPPFNPNWPPIAVPIASAATICVGVPVFFSGDASWDPDGSIVSYWWNFGDGTTSALANPEHTFTAPGLMDVTLTVMDDDGEMETESVQVNVTGLAVGASVQDVALLDRDWDVAISGGHAYVTSIPSGLTKVRLSDMAIVGNVALGAGSQPVATDGVHAYVGDVAGDFVTKVRLSDMAIVATVTDAVQLNYPAGIALSDGFAYVACRTGDSLTKIRTSDMVIVGTVTNPVTLDLAWCVTIAGDSAYVGCNGPSSRVTRVRLSDLAILGTVQDAVHLVSVRGIVSDGDFCYCTSGAFVTKVSIPALAVVDWATDAAVFTFARGIARSSVTGYLYVVCFAQDRVIRIRASDMAILDNVTDAALLDQARGIALEGTAAYVTAFAVDRLTRVDCAT